MDHEQLMLITRTMPMKTIVVRGEPYLERYFVGVDEQGNQDWLHHFLRADSEEHTHSHPWVARSTILCGGYLEQLLVNDQKLEEWLSSGDVNTITPGTLHRIIDVEPDTWTHMRVYAGREDYWYFIDDNGVKTQMRASEPDWYKQCSPRP